MSHIHDVYNTDERFEIDPDTRKITQKSGKSKLIRGDHNSECYAFSLPREIDGHDMSQCDRVRVHYINYAASGGERSTGPFEVVDLQVDKDDPARVVFSWLISKNVTKYAGKLNFSIEFRCTTESVVQYQWGTDVFNGISISDRVFNDGEETVGNNVDILEQWRDQLFNGGATNTSQQMSLIDTVSGIKYVLRVTDGKLTMSEAVS